jgi:haloacetate dehalogenase
MAALGYQRFAVAGHGRGGRVAYRLALDTPDAVERLAVLNVVPTLDAFEAIDAVAAVRLWHWFFHIEENELPERMIEAGLDAYLEHVLPRQTSSGFVLDQTNWDDYVTSFRNPAAIHAGCEDYRAAWHVDRLLDQADRGIRKIIAPLLVLWGQRGELARIDPLKTWRVWADDVRGWAVPTGHFIPEEASEAVVEAFEAFFDRGRE